MAETMFLAWLCHLTSYITWCHFTSLTLFLQLYVTRLARPCWGYLTTAGEFYAPAIFLPSLSLLCVPLCLFFLMDWGDGMIWFGFRWKWCLRLLWKEKMYFFSPVLLATDTSLCYLTAMSLRELPFLFNTIPHVSTLALSLYVGSLELVLICHICPFSWFKYSLCTRFIKQQFNRLLKNSLNT